MGPYPENTGDAQLHQVMSLGELMRALCVPSDLLEECPLLPDFSFNFHRKVFIDGIGAERVIVIVAIISLVVY